MSDSPRNPAQADFFYRLTPDLSSVMNDGCITVDDQSRIVMINPAAARMFRYSEAQLLGSHISRLIPERLRQAHASHVREFNNAGSLERPMYQRGPLQGLRANGEEFAIEAAVSRVQPDASLSSGHLFTVLLREHDVGASLEAQLDTLREQFRNVLELAPIAIWITDGDRIVFANRACLALFGIDSAQNIVDRSLFSLLRPESHHQVRRQMARALAGEANLPNVHERIERTDGSFRDLEIAISGLPEHGQTTLQMVLNNVTQRNAERFDLERSRQELRHLSASMVEAREKERRRIARELHDELGQRLSWLKMELSGLAAEANHPAMDNRIPAMLNMLDETVSSVRRIAADLRPLMLDDLGLNAAIDWLIRESARRMGIEVTVRLDQTDPALDASVSTAVYRMVQEALTNVSRHARATNVCVEMRRAGDNIVLTVSDNGIGFPASTTRKADSFGLLGIRERAHLLGGHLEADNPPGGGARIKVTLPRQAPADGAQEGNPAAKP